MDKNYFEIRYIKKRNSFRKIVTYKEENLIRKKHEDIVKFIEKNTIPSKFSKAYIKNRSIISNARAHMYNDVFIMMDIKNFFNSINKNRLIKILYYELNKKKKVSKIDCSKIVDLCSINKVGIPVGFVTSPILSNLYLKEFDNILYGILKRYNVYNLIYTRYADDMTISFKECENPKEILLKIQEEVQNLLKRYGLKLNTKKTKQIYFLNTNHIKVTGINIIKKFDNYRKLSVGNKRKNNLFWDAIKYYEMDRNQREEKKLKSIKGMLSFVLSVERIGFEDTFSKNMKDKIRSLGFESLKELIDSL